MTVLGQYSATVVASAANATPKITGIATHSSAAPTPRSKRNPRMTPVPRMSSVVRISRTVSVPNRETSTAAR